MKFDANYRRQSKKTLWDEELDCEISIKDGLNIDHVNNRTPSSDLDFSQNHFKAKKFICIGCKNEYDNHETERYKGNLYCKECIKGLIHYEG